MSSSYDELLAYSLAMRQEFWQQYDEDDGNFELCFAQWLIQKTAEQSKSTSCPLFTTLIANLLADLPDTPDTGQLTTGTHAAGNTTTPAQDVASYHCQCNWSRQPIPIELRISMLEPLLKVSKPLTADNTWPLMRSIIWKKWNTCRCFTDSMVAIFWRINTIQLQPIYIEPPETSPETSPEMSPEMDHEMSLETCAETGREPTEWTITLPLPPRRVRAWLTAIDFRSCEGPYGTFNDPNFSLNQLTHLHEAIHPMTGNAIASINPYLDELGGDINQVCRDTWQKLRDVCATGQLGFLHLETVRVYFGPNAQRLASGFYKWFIWIKTGRDTGVKINTDVDGWEEVLEEAVAKRRQTLFHPSEPGFELWLKPEFRRAKVVEEEEGDESMEMGVGGESDSE